MAFTLPGVFTGGGIDPAAPLRARVLKGARAGLYGAIGLTVFAAIIIGIANPTSEDLPGSTVRGLLFLYFGGGILGGTVYGALRPLLSSLLGTFLFLTALFAVLFGVLFLSFVVVEGEDFSPRLFLMIVGMAAVPALVFTPVLWGGTRGRSWAGPWFATLGILALIARNTLRYLEAFPDSSVGAALLHQWPILSGAGLLGLAMLIKARNKRAV